MSEKVNSQWKQRLLCTRLALNRHSKVSSFVCQSVYYFLTLHMKHIFISKGWKGIETLIHPTSSSIVCLLNSPSINIHRPKIQKSWKAAGAQPCFSITEIFWRLSWPICGSTVVAITGSLKTLFLESERPPAEIWGTSGSSLASALVKHMTLAEGVDVSKTHLLPL